MPNFVGPKNFGSKDETIKLKTKFKTVETILIKYCMFEN